MITATQKPFAEVYGSIASCRNVLVLGCGTCVTVCMAGGDKEAEILAATFRLADRERDISRTVRHETIERQCDAEFFDDSRQAISEADVIVSMACGVGVQYTSELFDGKRVVPALNTRFYGVTLEPGVWAERCAGCGECVLEKFGGICPISRCSKSLLNGPCGGSQNGKCEVDPESLDCGWQLIFDRMKRLDLLSRLEENESIKDWSTGRDGGPGTITREDVRL